MFVKWYKIVGLSEELAENWKEDLRDDIIVWKEGNDVEARIRLNLIEALRMAYLMRKNNKEQPYYKLQLVPV